MALALAAAAAASPAAAADLAGVVQHIQDGTVSWWRPPIARITVRLAMVDAPEVCHVKRYPSCRKPGQPFGLEAAESLCELTLGKQVQLQCAQAPDPYGRSLCDVLVAGRSVAREQVWRGWAWFSPYRSSSPELQAAEMAARLGPSSWSMEPGDPHQAGGLAPRLLGNGRG